ncbi:MAG: hypothetical protein HEP71_12910 [Roseivirga sp.]|nr:hypothetical protein [Roseivirga sp.]
MAGLNRLVAGGVVLLSLTGYLLLAYRFERTDHLAIFSLYALLFALGLWLTMAFFRFRKSWVPLFVTGLCFRVVFLVVTPHLSDDYFRFTWDGELQLEGESAFRFVPNDYREHFAGDSLNLQKFEELYKAHSQEFPAGINSKQYHSVYPPVSQFVFAISSLIGSPNEGNIVVMRLIMLLAEVVSFFILRRLLQAHGRALWLTGFYWLNPLVIIELTGNLHFEGFAITGLLLSLFFLVQRKTARAGMTLALAICTKVNPIFLMVAAFRELELKKFISFSLVTVLLSSAAFYLILDSETFWNFKNSFGLYFTWFEFNTGFFYLVRELGFRFLGQDVTSNISLIFPTLTSLLFVWISLSKVGKDLFERLLLLYVIYFSFTPIVHPWYITMLIPLAILSKRLYPLLWSFLIFFTYSAYGETYEESYTVIIVEYLLVYVLMYLEYSGRFAFIDRFREKVFGL